MKLTTDLICVFGAQVYGYNKYFFLIDENNIIIYFNIRVYNIVAANNSSVYYRRARIGRWAHATIVLEISCIAFRIQTPILRRMQLYKEIRR